MDWLPGALSSYIDKVRLHLDKALQDLPTDPGDILHQRVYPLLNIYESDTEVIVRCELPGVDKEDLDVSLAGRVLTISGKEKDDPEMAEWPCVRRERGWGQFSRSVQLPDTADLDGDPVARLAEGILAISVPKKSTSRPRKISIHDTAGPKPESE